MTLSPLANRESTLASRANVDTPLVIVSATSVRLSVNGPCPGFLQPHRGDVGFSSRRAFTPQHERRAIGSGHVEDRLEGGIRQRLQIARAGQHLRDAVQRLEMALRALQERQRRQRRRRRGQPVDLGRLDALADRPTPSRCRPRRPPSPCRPLRAASRIAILEHGRADANQVAGPRRRRLAPDAR